MNIKLQTGLLIGLLVVLSGVSGYLIGQGRESATVHTMADGSKMDNASMGMHDEMQNMMLGLSGKTGDELDKAFLKEMVVHHEGAVEMAEAVLASGKHEELKEMARAIIAAQTAEIAQMKAWSAAWYGN
jgi:uncharacterized protein (DUF305 family)